MRNRKEFPCDRCGENTHHDDLFGVPPDRWLCKTCIELREKRIEETLGVGASRENP